MGSSRLPGKVLKSVTNTTSVLQFQLEQLSFSKSIEKIVIATTTLDEDIPIVTFCRENNIECFRGEPKKGPTPDLTVTESPLSNPLTSRLG